MPDMLLMERNMAPEIKVLQVSHSLATGGLERVVLDLAQKGAGYGFTSMLASLTKEGEMGRMARTAGCPLFELHKKPGLDWRMPWRLFRLIKKSGADLVHAHNEGAAFYSGLAAKLAGRPLVATLHGFNIERRDRLLRRSVGGLAARVICVGAELAEEAREKYGLSPDKLEVIYNGVDLSQFSPDPKVRDAARAMLNLDKSDKLVISVGRLAREKNYRLLLDAAAATAGSHQGLKVALVGEGPQREELAAHIESLGMEGRFMLLGERRDVPELLNASDIFVLSSLSEGISKSLLEAMAVALPVLATDVGGNAEVVDHGVTGLLTPSGSVPDLARSLSRVLDDGEWAGAMGEAGRKRAGERFSLEATLTSHARLYRRLTTKGANHEPRG